MLRKYAIKWHFIFPPHLTTASVLYLGKQETRQLRVFSRKRWMILCQQTTQNAFKLPPGPGHGWTTPRSQNGKSIHRICTREGRGSALSSASCYSQTLIIYQVCHNVDGCLKMRAVLRRAWTKSQSTALSGYLAVSQQTLAATELDTDWMHPWIGLDWVGLDWVECWKNLDGLDWIGLRRIVM